MKPPPAILLCVALAACQSASDLESSADKAAAEILREKSANSVDRRPETVVLPEHKTEAPAPTPESAVAPPRDTPAPAVRIEFVPRVLSLHEALDIAVRSGRER